MLVKRSWLLIGIVAVTLAGALAFSGCVQQEKAIGDDYLFYQKSEIAVEYLHISKSGYAEFTTYRPTYDDARIFKHNSGTLSEGDMRELSEFIENSGFFKLGAAYPPLIHPLFKFLPDYGYYRISVCREGKVKSVYVFDGAPAPFGEVRDYLREKVKPQLTNDPRYGTFIMAEREKYWECENVLSEEDLETHPFLAQAIRNPEWFIYVGSLDNTELEDYIIQGRYYFFVAFEDNVFHVSVIERAE